MSCKIKTRISLIVVLIAMVAMLMPQIAAPVYAEGEPVIAHVSQGKLNEGANCHTARTVWYANKAWRVINYNGQGDEYTFKPYNIKIKTDPIYKVRAMTLFAANNLKIRQKFNWESEKLSSQDPRFNDYKDSPLQKAVDDLFTSLFSEKEQLAVLERELSVDEYDGKHDSNGVSGTATTGYLWPLSTAEAIKLGEEIYYKYFELPDPFDGWWLRSPGGQYYAVACVYCSQEIDPNGCVANFTDLGVRPAFNLDLAYVLFTSAAEGGKSSGTVGVDALQKVNTYLTNEWKLTWKLTLKDDGTVIDTKTGLPNTGLTGHKDFEVTECTYTDNGVSVKYTGAKTGTNEYISAIITNKPITEADVNITYYGRLKNCASADTKSGTVEINTAGKLGSADTLYVFNEQCNGDRETDYASTLYEVNPYPPVGRIKAANPLKIKGKTATVKYNKLKKKSQTLTVTKVIKFTKDIKDQKTYKLSSAKKGKKSFSKYFKINKTTGKVTVKKGLKKGTYKVKVKVQAKGNSRYKASKVMPVTFKIKVK